MPLRQMRQIRGSLVESQHPTNCTDIKAQAAPAFETPNWRPQVFLIYPSVRHRGSWLRICWWNSCQLRAHASCIQGMWRLLSSSLWPRINQKMFVFKWWFPKIGLPSILMGFSPINHYKPSILGTPFMETIQVSSGAVGCMLCQNCFDTACHMGAEYVILSSKSTNILRTSRKDRDKQGLVHSLTAILRSLCYTVSCSV